MRKLGILGGTFDPVHWGHLLIAQTALNQVGLEQIIWVPSQFPHYKKATEFKHRLEMVQRAIADNLAFVISPIIGDPLGAALRYRSDPTYAIQTLINLKAIYPNTSWYWILGLDAFQTLPKWYGRQRLIDECEWLVAPRIVSAGSREQEVCEQVAQQLAEETAGIRWQMLHLPLVEISSSLIRQYCRNSAVQTLGDRCSIRYLVPESVRFYIITHNLYSQLENGKQEK